MNRQRRKDESFKEYRDSQTAESDAIRQKLSGKYVHVSKVYTAEGRPLPGNTRGGPFEAKQKIIAKRKERTNVVI